VDDMDQPFNMLKIYEKCVQSFG